MRLALAEVSSRLAKARTATARVWVPALPPTEDTIGISTARATTLATSSWKMAIEEPAMVSVTRFRLSHGRRDLTMPQMVASRPAAPAGAGAGGAARGAAGGGGAGAAAGGGPAGRPPAAS